MTRFSRLPWVVLVALSIFWPGSAPAADLPLDVLAKNPKAYLNVPIVVQGSVVFTGDNYYSDPEPRFVLRNGKGVDVPVRPWLPIERIVPPVPTEGGSPPPKTMRDLLGKEVRVHGTISQNARTKAYEIDVEEGEVVQ